MSPERSKAAQAAHYFVDFWRFVKPYNRPLRIVYILYFTNALLNLLPALSVRYYIDLVLMEKDARLLGMVIPGCEGMPTREKIMVSMIFLCAMTLLIVIANIVGVFMWRLGTKNVESVVFDIKIKIHQHINRLSIGYFNEERVGTIMTKAVDDVNNISMLLRSSFSLTYAFVQFLLAPVLMLMNSWVLFLVVLIPMPLVCYAFYSINTKLRPMYRQQREHQSQIASQIQETVSGIREIKAFDVEGKSHASYQDINRRFYNMQNRIMRVFSINHQLQYGARDWSAILLAAFGGTFILFDVGNVSVGKITAFIMLTGFVYNPLSQFLSFFDVIQRGMVALERVVGFLREEPRVSDLPHAICLADHGLDGKVEFKHVCFSYDGRTQVINDVSCVIESGQRVAIVGSSGSGKSTLLSLLMRFYDVGSGNILIDGRDIREYTQMTLRRNIGVVFQETFLFYGTIRDNLMFVNARKSEYDMIEACRTANILDTILELPDQFDTMVGERGAKLSGGQKQRISIARVLLKDPSIVILDEATSAVDTVSERLIKEGIEHMLTGKTAFIVAHRLSTVADCDRIIVLDRGAIAEIGSHSELLAHGGMYADLCRNDLK